MFAACILSLCTGFLSLSLEILWVRLFSYANHSLPQAFAFVLAFYLLGIALGAYLGKKCCQRSWNLWRVSGIVLLIASLCAASSPFFYAFFVHDKYQLPAGAFFITLTALLLAILFPISHHLGAKNFNGKSVSRVYVSNIMGATLGPFFAGMVLLSFFSTQQSFIICGVLTFFLSIYCLARQWSTSFIFISVMNAAILGFLFTVNSHWLIAQASQNSNPDKIIENQYGIVAIYKGEKGDDIVTGANVYDGRTNLNPVINSNGLHRIIVMSALHPAPKKVLMIGLSIGTWLKILETFPGVEKIDVVEINPGYLTAIRDYPQQASALRDPRVDVYIDDGRRWLAAHPEKKYDMVVMNTTYYWRAYSANLLSREFLTLLKQHMQPDAVLTYNTTSSPDALKTAVALFKHAYLYQNFVIAADFDWRKKLHDQAAFQTLSHLEMDNALLFPAGSDKTIHAFLNLPLIELDMLESLCNALGREVEIVTDRNLITEYKYGKSLGSGI